MDLAKRIAKIVQNQRGVLVFVKTAEPNTGFATVYKVVSYTLAAMNNDDIIAAIRGFLMSNLLIEDGIAAYRRSGTLTLARVTVFATQTEAEIAARAANVSHIINMTDKTTIQVADFAPDVPGDGDV